MKSCENCTKFNTCKFVEKNNSFKKEMYGMFRYPEWNNLDKLFYQNASKCNFFVDNSDKIEDLLDKLEIAKYQMNWINDYVTNINKERDAEFTVNKLKEITANYLKELSS